MVCRSASPDSSRWVANECLSVWGWTRFPRRMSLRRVYGSVVIDTAVLDYFRKLLSLRAAVGAGQKALHLR